MKSKHEITLDENHVYHVDGRVVPGVTGIIRAAGLMDSHGWNEYSRDKGTAVHRAVELYERGTLDEDSLDPVILPYLDGWRSFRAGTGYESDTLEQIVYSPLYRYAGTLDQTGRIGGKTCVLDIKTGQEQRWWALQTAAYNGVAKRTERYSLSLPGDGQWKLIPHKEKNDLQVFLACLTVAGWKGETGARM